MQVMCSPLGEETFGRSTYIPTVGQRAREPVSVCYQ